MNDNERFIICYVVIDNDKRSKFVEVITAPSKFKAISITCNKFNIKKILSYYEESDLCNESHIKYCRNLDTEENDIFYQGQHPKFEKLKSMDGEIFSKFENSIEIFEKQFSELDE
jgi:hypothetical protein